jgi:hypothetical protein
MLCKINGTPRIILNDTALPGGRRHGCRENGRTKIAGNKTGSSLKLFNKLGVCKIFENPCTLKAVLRDKAAIYRIISMEPQPEPQRDAALAPMAPAPNLMFNIGGLSKMS